MHKSESGWSRSLRKGEGDARVVATKENSNSQTLVHSDTVSVPSMMLGKHAVQIEERHIARPHACARYLHHP